MQFGFAVCAVLLDPAVWREETIRLVVMVMEVVVVVLMTMVTIQSCTRF